MSGIKDFVLSLKSPVIFHDKIGDWELLKWSEKDWCTQLGDDPLPFRCGLKKCTANPQWERSCRIEHEPLSRFFLSANDSDCDTWKYFDYKYLNQWLEDCEAFKTLSWANLGFPEITKNDCTIWIGSAGAHTPCHMDSYGCNLVAQIYGHKQWILFPPSESANLKMTRVPYEEASVYSALNFNAPIEGICNSLDNIYIVTLSPGDVLFVPHHWWHYVENLDTAIAINTWLPFADDDNCRLDEALVQFFISQISPNLSPTLASEVLNPNEENLCAQELLVSVNQIKFCTQNVLKASDSSLNLTEGLASDEVQSKKCLDFPDQREEDFCKTVNKDSKKRKLLPDHSQVHPKSCTSCDKVLKDQFDFEVLNKCNVSDLNKVLEAKCKCSSKEEHKEIMKLNTSFEGNLSLLPAVINSFCHPDVLKIVKRLLLEQFASKNM